LDYRVVTRYFRSSWFIRLVLFISIMARGLSRPASTTMRAVTGRGLAALIREKTGIRLVFSIMAVLLAVDFGNTLAEFSGISVSGSIFGVPPYVSLPLAALFIKNGGL